MTVKDFYDNFDENARLSGNDNRHKVELYRKRFLYQYLIEMYNPKKVVQIACGTGIHTHWLCEKYPHIEFYASDIVDKHVEQLKDYKNLHKQVWDCTKNVPKEYKKANIVLVEGAWYHLDLIGRKELLKNLYAIDPKIIIIDWLSAWHDTTQRLLQDKKSPLNYRNPRPNEPFRFDTADDLYALKRYFNVQLFPVDLDLRFGYKDLNQVSEEEFNKYMSLMNEHFKIYDSNQTFIMDATEHGCYILTSKDTKYIY